MKSPRTAAAAVCLLVLAATGAGSKPAGPADPLAAEIARWQAFVAGHVSTDELWLQVKEASQAMLADAAQALVEGRRELALQRLASARISLAAAEYLDGRPRSDLESPEAFEAEWRRVGNLLSADLHPPRPDDLAGVRPAAARALAEAARFQEREYYDSALEYGRNTMAKYGLYYVGAARAQKDFVEFARTLKEPSRKPVPALRPLGAELDGLEDALLAAYRPPAAIDRHPDFIAASGSLKEARELDAAGLRYGALYKYLQAAQRLPVERPGGGASEKLAAFEKRLDASPTDASIGRLYLDIARADLAAAKSGAPAAAAVVIADDVLPRYFAALEPAPAPASRPAPEVTVTLVRWPYT